MLKSVFFRRGQVPDFENTPTFEGPNNKQYKAAKFPPGTFGPQDHEKYERWKF